MLFAKINPPARFVDDNSLFSGTIKELEYMTASVRPYNIGADKFKIEVAFGDITYNNENNLKFVRFLTNNILMTKEELLTWGTDDSVALELIASKLGTSVTEVIELNQIFF